MRCSWEDTWSWCFGDARKDNCNGEMYNRRCACWRRHWYLFMCLFDCLHFVFSQYTNQQLEDSVSCQQLRLFSLYLSSSSWLLLLLSLWNKEFSSIYVLSSKVCLSCIQTDCKSFRWIHKCIKLLMSLSLGQPLKLLTGHCLQTFQFPVMERWIEHYNTCPCCYARQNKLFPYCFHSYLACLQ